MTRNDQCKSVLREMMEGLEKINLRDKTIFGSAKSSGLKLEKVAFSFM